MADNERKAKVKKLLEGTGKALGGGAGENRLVVIRFPNHEQIVKSLNLFPKAFPRINWQGVPVSSGHLFNLVQAATAASSSPQHKVSVLYDFPGELDDRVLSLDAAEDLERAAVTHNLLKTSIVLAVLPPSIRVLAEKAPTLWKGKAGYFAWPTTVRLPEEVESGSQQEATTQTSAAALSAEERPTEEETRKVLRNLTGKEAADYLVNVARSHLSGGDNEQARLFLLRAVQIYSETAHLDGMAEGYLLLGIGAEQRGDYATAVDWFTQAVDSYTIADDLVHLSEAISRRGYVRYLHGQYESAVRDFNEALSIDQKLGDKERESAGYRKIAMVLEIMKNFPAAQELHEKSLAIEKDLGNLAGQARVFHHLGRLNEMQLEYDAAVELYEQSLDLKLKLNDRAGIATTHHQLGNLHLMRKSFPEALEQYEKALEAEKSQGDRQGLARTHAQKGLAHRELGQVEEALYHLILAYQVFQRLRSPLAGEVLAKVEELQDLVPADTFNRILRDASATTSSM